MGETTLRTCDGPACTQQSANSYAEGWLSIRLTGQMGNKTVTVIKDICPYCAVKTTPQDLMPRPPPAPSTPPPPDPAPEE